LEHSTTCEARWCSCQPFSLESLWPERQFCEFSGITALLRMRRLVFIEGRNTGQLRSDHLCRLGSDVLVQMDPVGHGPELADGRDVLSPQHLPRPHGQTETFNRSFANFTMMGRHRLLVSAHARQRTLGSVSETRICHWSTTEVQCFAFPSTAISTLRRIRLEVWGGWDGAAPPPYERAPRRRLLHPHCRQFSRKRLRRDGVSEVLPFTDTFGKALSSPSTAFRE
jgi:hypothetical protein